MFSFFSHFVGPKWRKWQRKSIIFTCHWKNVWIRRINQSIQSTGFSHFCLISFCLSSAVWLVANWCNVRSCRFDRNDRNVKLVFNTSFNGFSARNFVLFFLHLIFSRPIGRILSMHASRWRWDKRIFCAFWRVRCSSVWSRCWQMWHTHKASTFNAKTFSIHDNIHDVCSLVSSKKRMIWQQRGRKKSTTIMHCIKDFFSFFAYRFFFSFFPLSKSFRFIVFRYHFTRWRTIDFDFSHPAVLLECWTPRAHQEKKNVKMNRGQANAKLKEHGVDTESERTEWRKLRMKSKEKKYEKSVNRSHK